MVNDLRASISAAPPRDVESRTQVKAHIQVIVTNETLFTNELRINPETFVARVNTVPPDDTGALPDHTDAFTRLQQEYDAPTSLPPPD